MFDPMNPQFPPQNSGMMYASGAPQTQIAPVLPGMGQQGGGGMGQGMGMNWGGLLGGQRSPFDRSQVQGALGQFRDARQDWQQGGRVGDRPRFMNYLMPGAMGGMGGGQGGQMGMPGQPQMMPPLGQPTQPPMMPPQGVGTGLGVAGMTTPASPFGLPGYGG